MASSRGEEEVEYESDPEDANNLLSSRRRDAASDDEEGDEAVTVEKLKINHRAPIHSDESDGQGGAAEYDDDEEEYLDEEEEEYVEYEEGQETYQEDTVDGERLSSGGFEVGANVVDIGTEKDVQGSLSRNADEVEEDDAVNIVEEDEERKENERFSVPTAGAFYMHDDRFKESTGGRGRKTTYGGRKLWESRDDKKWGHDKFEEMSSQQIYFEEGRKNSRGYRGRGRNRAPDRGYDKGDGSRPHNNSSINQNQPKTVRGRGPIRYEPSTSTKYTSQPRSSQNKQYKRPQEKHSHSNSGRSFMPVSTANSDQPLSRKEVFASSLSSASPPFYPSGSSSKDVALSSKRDYQTGSTSRSTGVTGINEGSSNKQNNAMIQASQVDNSFGTEKLYINESMGSTTNKPLNNLPFMPSGSLNVNNSQSSRSKNHGKDVSVPNQVAYQPTTSSNQVRFPNQAQVHASQKNPIQNRGRNSFQASPQQLRQRSVNESQASSPPKTALSTSSHGEVESSYESNKSKSTLVRKGKDNAQGSGQGSFMYTGGQAMGASGSIGIGRADQNFPSTPTFLPVMQFGGQHPGGIGVPTVGMAFPGYVANPNGSGNREMTWLPVLAGGPGGLGATYCPPYIAVDGAYGRPSGQSSSMGSSSKEKSPNKPNNESNPDQSPEHGNAEFGTRQNKPSRRYSEMKFSQSST